MKVFSFVHNVLLNIYVTTPQEIIVGLQKISDTVPTKGK